MVALLLLEHEASTDKGCVVAGVLTKGRSFCKSVAEERTTILALMLFIVYRSIVLTYNSYIGIENEGIELQQGMLAFH